MPHIIRCFDRVDESYIGETQLLEIALTKLQEVFQLPPDNPMYDSYPIDEKKAKIIYEYVGVGVEIEQYDCFLEYDE